MMTCRSAISINSRNSAIIVAAAAVIVYANSLLNGFAWDDLGFIAQNPILKKSPADLFSGIYPFFLIDGAPYYRPLTILTFMFDERLHGLNPMFMHLFSLLLHACNALLVWRLAGKFIKDNNAAVLAGLLFAVHPINTEAVNFISTRNDLLAAFFILAAFLLHHRSINNRSYRASLSGGFFFFCALLSKESGLLALPFIAFLEFRSFRTEGRYDMVSRLGRIAPYALLGIVYYVMRSNAIPVVDSRLSILEGLSDRLVANLYIIPKYLQVFLWPAALNPVYYVPDDLHLLVLPLLAAWLIIIAILFSLLKGRSTAAMFGLFWLVLFWLPVSGIVRIPSSPMAERFMYVPSIGLWIIAADRFSYLSEAGDKVRRYGYIGAAIILLIFSSVTINRNRDWKNDLTLFSRYVEQFPDRAIGHCNLACAYLDHVGDLEAAEREFNMALEIDPLFPKLRTQLGYIYLLRKDYEQALVHYDMAVQHNPFDSEAHLNRGIVLEKLGRTEEAVIEYRLFLAAPGIELEGSRPFAEQKLKELSR